MLLFLAGFVAGVLLTVLAAFWWLLGEPERPPAAPPDYRAGLSRAFSSAPAASDSRSRRC